MPVDPSLRDDRRDRGRRLEALARDRWRDRRGVSGLALATGVSRATLYSWFRGDTTPDLDAASRLAIALQMPTSELLAVLGGGDGQDLDFVPRQERSGLADITTGEPPRNPRLDLDPARTEDRLSDSEGIRTARWSPRDSSQRPAYSLGVSAHIPARSASEEERRLLDVLLGQPVMTCRSDEPIGAVVERMFERGYSQLPVYRGGNLVGLLTGDTVTRWYAASRDAGGALADRTPVSEVLAFAEAGRLFELVGPDESVQGTLTLFVHAMNDGAPITAVVVTSDATAAGRPLGIVTSADLPRLSMFRS